MLSPQKHGPDMFNIIINIINIIIFIIIHIIDIIINKFEKNIVVVVVKSHAISSLFGSGMVFTNLTFNCHYYNNLYC